MINVTVFANNNVSIGNIEYHLETREQMSKFLEDLIDKMFYSGEHFCLELGNIVENKVNFIELKRW